MHNRGPAYDFELGDFGQIIEDFILDPVRKVGVIFICADVLERQTAMLFSVGAKSALW
jgi:hypothetical protein